MLPVGTPRVSVGVPVYNGADVIRQALDSLLGQSFKDFEILISDNCSSDETAAICNEYAAIDPRIHYVRQRENLGAAGNFRYVLENSRGEYFFWNAADDIRSPDFIEVNVNFLDMSPGHVASTSPTRFVGGQFDPARMGDSSLEGSPEANVLSFFHYWHANGRFYSIFRRNVLASCQAIGRSYFGSDWTVVLECCLRGKFHRCDRGWTLIGKGGVSQSRHRFTAFRNHWWEALFPLSHFSKEAWRIGSEFSWVTRARLTVILCGFNAMATWAQIRLNMRRSAKQKT